ncbi:methionyl-tRNA formyltransferase [Deltaproteobacteria bacterium OttesenSCG-928-K17]|nr:methionyl-tRNA formyltransferase [Deltaproteobacteria bacterium OttesenSCG-928-K17]
MNINHKCLFIGSKQIGLEVLRLILKLAPASLIGAATLDDAGDSRSVKSTFDQLARKSGLPLEAMSDPMMLGRLVKELKPDFVLVVGWYRLIPEKILNLAPLGFVGVHASPLPAYRGGAPVVWQIINGEPEIGVSLFKLAPGIDSGDIIDQRFVPISPDQHVGEVLEQVNACVLDQIADNFPRFLNGHIEGIRQNEASASYCSARVPQDGLIDWRLPAKYIKDFIRAQSRPYPGAFCQYANGEELILWRARLFPHPYYGVPGRVGQVYDGGVVVSCGQGAIIIDDIGINGREMPAREILRFGDTLR